MTSLMPILNYTLANSLNVGAVPLYFHCKLVSSLSIVWRVWWSDQLILYIPLVYESYSSCFFIPSEDAQRINILTVTSALLLRNPKDRYLYIMSMTVFIKMKYKPIIYNNLPAVLILLLLVEEIIKEHFRYIALRVNHKIGLHFIETTN
jgi:hypothetical protein